MWLEGFLIALKPMNLLFLLAGNFIGLIIGVLPAVGPAFGVALMLPFTFGMDAVSALIFLCAIHATCAYGDSITSILMKTPGSSISVPSCWDGFPLTQKGKGGMALGIAAVGSFLGGFVGWLLLVAIAKPITRFAIEIGAPEYFALGVMALGLVSLASKGEALKGILWACIGLSISFVGGDPITGLTSRFSFGVVWLEGGIPISISMLGLFAMAQVAHMMEQGESIIQVKAAEDNPLTGFVEVLKRPITFIRSSIIGLFIGVLPALGTTLASVTGYLVEQKYSREKAEFGQGAPAGLVAAEASKGACVVGDLIPTFTLGIPGSITAAILMGALIIHGIDPGPRFMTSGNLPYAVFAGILLTQACLLLTGISVAKYFARIVFVPNAILAPMIVTLCFLGAYAERNAIFDVALMILFGTVGWLSGRARYPVVSMLLGILLGPLVEVNFHRSLRIGLGSYGIFFTRPITVVLLLITFAFMAWPFVSSLFKREKGKHRARFKTEESQETKSDSVWAEFGLLVLVVLFFGLTQWESWQYSRDTVMFPKMVSILGLGLGIYHLLILYPRLMARNRKELQVGGAKTCVPAWLSFSCFGGYALLFYLVGFPVATVLYVVGAAWIAGYRRMNILVPLSIGTGICLYLFAWTMRIPLPAWGLL
ncbi:MAG: tripartite tricarboxylate transporter permease [Thermodesulfobacteriota bacterium]